MSDAPYLGKGARSPYPKSWHFRRLAWLAVGEPLFRCSPRPFYGFRNALLRLWGAEISAGVKLYPSVSIFFPWNLRAEGPCLVGPRVNVYNLDMVILRRGCIVSQDTHLCAGTHDYLRWDFPLVRKPVEIGENAWVCSEAFVGPGVVVGELAVVAARAVVVKSVEPRVIVGGNPAKFIQNRKDPV